MVSDESRRKMYAGGRPNRLARWMNDLSAKAFSLGLSPHWAVTLETANPATGKPLVLPLVIAQHGNHEYLVSMLGQGSVWVRDVRAAGGHAVIRAGRRRPVLLKEVSAANRAPILKAYLAQAPGARAHIPVDKDEPVEKFETIAPDYPVFEIRYV
jgi:hypothetical protein